MGRGRGTANSPLVVVPADSQLPPSVSAYLGAIAGAVQTA